MDQMFEKLVRYFPNSGFVEIPAYDPKVWKDREYDSGGDTKATRTKWASEPLTADEARQCIEEGKRIGWVVPKGYVVIDIDNKEEIRAQQVIERILKKFDAKYSYNYTNHGIHMLFQDPSGTIKSNTKMKCALNLIVDTRANGTGYIVLPCNDPHREWGEWREYVEDIPYFLKPIVKDKDNLIGSFVGMDDGDGRNDALFKWRSKLELTSQLSAAEIEKSIRIINEYLFLIALPNPELYKTVLRDKEKTSISAKQEKHNKYNDYADEIVKKYNIIAMRDCFYMFNGLYYKRIDKIDIEALVHKEIDTNIGRAGRSEIVDFIKLKCQHSDSDFNKDWYKIAVKNGILNLITCKIEPATPTDYNTIGIDWRFVEDPVPSPLIIDFISSLAMGDPLKVQFLYEVAGYCLLKKNIFAKFFVFQGEGGTGKSTYTNLIQKLVGSENTSHITLPDFDKDYQLSSVYNKLVNIDDDVVDNKTLINSGRFKSLVAGELISARPIYKDIIEFVPFCTCIFSCNKLPSIMDDTSGMYRRIILVELNHKIEHPDPLFLNKITEMDMEYFLYKSAVAISQVIQRGTFTINDSEQKLLERFKHKQNALLDFICDRQFTVASMMNQRTLAVYSQFKAWCEDNGFSKFMNAMNFKEDICRLYNLGIGIATDKNGRPIGQAFVPIDGAQYDPEFIPV